MKVVLLILMLGLFLQPVICFSEEKQIIIKNHQFTPAKLTINVGDKVTWINQDNDPHNIMDKSNDKTIHSPALDTNDTYSFTFSSPLTFNYFCTFHPLMQGEIIVK